MVSSSTELSDRPFLLILSLDVANSGRRRGEERGVEGQKNRYRKINELAGRDIKMIKCWKRGAAFTTTQILAGTEPQGLASATNVNMEGI